MVTVVRSGGVDPFERKRGWEHDIAKDEWIDKEHLERTYVKKHTWAWQVGQTLWAALQTICTLGLALLTQYTRDTWKAAFSGKEVHIVRMMDFNPFAGGGGGGGGGGVDPSVDDGGVEVVGDPFDIGNVGGPNPPPVTAPPGGPDPVAPAKPAAPKGPVKYDPVKAYAAYLDAGVSKTNAATLVSIEELEQVVEQIAEDVGKPSMAGAVWMMESARLQYSTYDEVQRAVSKAYAQIKQEFQNPQIKRDNQFVNGVDEAYHKHRAGDKVKPFFSNVPDPNESWYSRMYRSICGPESLAAEGPAIFDQLREKLFIEGKHNYGPNEGLNRLLTITGTVVDLCTTLSGVVGYDMASRDQSAKELAREYIEIGFKEQFKGFRARFASRKLDIPYAIPNAASNDDRGDHGVWRFGAALDKYAVNVPEMVELIGALLKAPLLFAHSFILVQSIQDPVKRNDWLQDFLKSEYHPGVKIGSISQGCLNAKWTLICKFNNAIRSEFALQAKKGGGAAVPESEIVNKVINDESILPPDELRVDKRASKGVWKAHARAAYIAKAKSMGLYSTPIEVVKKGKKTHESFEDNLDRMMDLQIQIEEGMGSDRFK